MGFSKDFVWGTATASYQIEGAAREGGKGVSIWDEFCRVPGAVFGGHTGDVACDHYHRFRDDIALMKRMGVRAYRFSLSWPRILPEGSGAVNEAGLRFYEELVDELLRNEITPYVTLFHWDYPAALQKRGGWLNPESPFWFQKYAEIVARRFAGKVRHYFTINEPQCFIGHGYGTGVHAPGWKLPAADLFSAAHHVLLAHGLAVDALREFGGTVKVGLAQCGAICIPATQSPEDLRAAKTGTFSILDDPIKALFSVALWSDPLFKGDYPEEFYKKFPDAVPKIGPNDFKIIGRPLDFYGQNIYTATPVRAEGDGIAIVPFAPGTAKSDSDWPITPEGIYWAARLLFENYQKPVIISENGMAAHDAVSLDGRVHDPNRIDYLHRYLLELRRAAGDGAKVAGYFCWSFLDNFEWARGYNERFGLVYVDYATQRRIPKDSAEWCGEVILANGENL